MARVGLLLSGGMAKGAYQLGALEAIKRWFKASDITCISAASIGAINAYSFVMDNLPEARVMWDSVSSSKDIRWIMKAMKREYVEGLIDSIYAGRPVDTTMFVPLIETESRTLQYVDYSKIPEDRLRNYLAASVAMPFYCGAINIDGNSYYDGAMVDNLPAKPLTEMDLDYIICLYFDDYNYMFESEEFNRKCIKLTFTDRTIISNSIMLSKTRTDNMVAEGFRHTEAILSQYFAGGTDDLEYIYAKIDEYNAENKNIRTRLTGDFLVDNMNRFTKKLLKEKRG